MNNDKETIVDYYQYIELNNATNLCHYRKKGDPSSAAQLSNVEFPGSATTAGSDHDFPKSVEFRTAIRVNGTIPLQKSGVGA